MSHLESWNFRYDSASDKLQFPWVHGLCTAYQMKTEIISLAFPSAKDSLMRQSNKNMMINITIISILFIAGGFIAGASATYV